MHVENCSFRVEGEYIGGAGLWGFRRSKVAFSGIPRNPLKVTFSKKLGFLNFWIFYEIFKFLNFYKKYEKDSFFFSRIERVGKWDFSPAGRDIKKFIESLSSINTFFQFCRDESQLFFFSRTLSFVVLFFFEGPRRGVILKNL